MSGKKQVGDAYLPYRYRSIVHRTEIRCPRCRSETEDMLKPLMKEGRIVAKILKPLRSGNMHSNSSKIFYKLI